MPGMGIDPFFTVEVERSQAPQDADAFARCVILAICNASVSESVGRRTFERCLRAIAMGATARVGFRHPGKAEAVDLIWRERHGLFRAYRESNDKVAFLSTLPWIGPVTRRKLAWDLGLTNDPAETERRAVA